MKFYCETKEAVLAEVASSAEGLSGEEAARRLEKNGKNKLAEPEKPSLLRRFLSALNDPMIFLLLGAAAISTATTIYQNTAYGAHENYADLFIILLVVPIKTGLSVVPATNAAPAAGRPARPGASPPRCIGAPPPCPPAPSSCSSGQRFPYRAMYSPR